LNGVPRGRAAEAYASVFFDRRWREMSRILRPEWLAETDVPALFVDEHFARPGADTSVDAALRIDTSIMLTDDPVKRVDNMTMAWGLEARVPFLDHELVELAGRIPPQLKLQDGGKGVVKRAARGIVPDAVIDRTKGYFPVPAIRQLEGPYLQRVRDALLDPAARERGFFHPATVESMLANPNDTRTTLGSNALWQLATLEMWLQAQGVTS
jgi:asparagine synthase (glutamine-hydrolysing)